MTKPDPARLWEEHTAHEFSTRDAEAIVGFRTAKLAHEHIYWNQVSVLK